jgi:hypothetical protein
MLLREARSVDRVWLRLRLNVLPTQPTKPVSVPNGRQIAIGNPAPGHKNLAKAAQIVRLVPHRQQILPRCGSVQSAQPVAKQAVMAARPSGDATRLPKRRLWQDGKCTQLSRRFFCQRPHHYGSIYYTIPARRTDILVCPGRALLSAHCCPSWAGRNACPPVRRLNNACNCTIVIVQYGNASNLPSRS